MTLNRNVGLIGQNSIKGNMSKVCSYCCRYFIAIDNGQVHVEKQQRGSEANIVEVPRCLPHWKGQVVVASGPLGIIDA